MAGVALTRFLCDVRLPSNLRSLSAGLLLGITSVIASDIVRLHPYEYVYFNRLVGGLPGAQARFETEYWGASYTEGLRWLAAQLDPRDRSPVRIASCNHDGAIEHFIQQHPALAQRVRLEHKSEAADIFLATTRTGCHKPEGEVLHVVQRMGVPFLYVIQQRALLSNGPLVARSK